MNLFKEIEDSGFVIRFSYQGYKLFKDDKIVSQMGLTQPILSRAHNHKELVSYHEYADELIKAAIHHMDKSQVSKRLQLKWIEIYLKQITDVALYQISKDWIRSTGLSKPTLEINLRYLVSKGRIQRHKVKIPNSRHIESYKNWMYIYKSIDK